MMRVTNIDFHRKSIDSILMLQNNIQRAELQLSQQTRLLNPSDDPVATSHIRAIESYLAEIESYDVNNVTAANQLGLIETTLGSVTNTLMRVNELQQQSMVGTLQPNDKKAIARELNELLNELMALANSQDPEGNYMFSGFQSSAPPYVNNNGEINYLGDAGQRQLQVGASNFVTISYTGEEIFDGLSNSSGGSTPENIFNTIQNFINVLQMPVSNDDEQALYIQNMDSIASSLDQGLENVLSVITQLGATMSSLDNQLENDSNLIIQNKEMLSTLKDLDPVEATSNLLMQMNTLQAAYLSFTRISELSLLNFL